MPALMVYHVPLRPETQPAIKRAREWLLVPMDPHMRLQALSLSELSATALKVAPKRLQAGMLKHMGSHARFSSEVLIAAGMLTHIGFLILIQLL